jgi:hypothetical protein
MKLEFYEADLLGMGAATSSGQEMVAKLLLSFLDTDAKLINHVRLDIFVPKDQKITFGEMQKAARANAIEVLKAALSTLEKHDIPTLEKMGEETRSGHIATMFGGDEKTD